MAQKTEKVDEWDAPNPALSALSVPVEGEDEWSHALPGTEPKPAVKQAEGAARLMMLPHALATGVENQLGLAGQIQALINPEWQSQVGSRLPDTGNESLNALMLSGGMPLGPLPTGSQLAKATGLGLSEHPELAPRNALERYGSAAVESLPAAATIVMTGGGSLPTALASAEGGALAAQGAADVFPKTPWAPVVAGVIGSLGAGWASKSVENFLAGREATRNLDAAEKALLAAKQAKVTGSQETEKAGLKFASANSAKLSATEQLAEDARLAAEHQTKQTFHAVADSLGESKTLEEAGTRLQESARDWMQRVLPAKLKAVAEPLDKAVPGSTQTPLKNYVGTLQALTKSDPSVAGQIDLLSSALPKKLLENLTAGEEMDELAQAATTVPTWAGARAIRTRLGDALSNPTLLKGMDQQEITALYAAISKDLGETAAKVGAGDAWKAFNAESTRLHELAAGPMGKLITTVNAAKEVSGIQPGQAAKALINSGKTGGAELAALRSEIPEAVDDLAAQQLRTEGAWKALSPEARSALVPHPERNQALGGALQTELTAKQAAEATVQAAKESYEAEARAFKEAAVAAKHARSNALTDAAAARLAAKAAVPKKPNALTDFTSTLKKLGAAGIGAYEAPYIFEKLGIHMPPEAATALGASVIGAPLVGQMGRTLISNPATATIPLAGATAGQNALSVPKP